MFGSFKRRPFIPLSDGMHSPSFRAFAILAALLLAHFLIIQRRFFAYLQDGRLC